MFNKLFNFVLLFGLGSQCLAQKNIDDNAIQPYSENPYYWQYKGVPVLLLGGSAQDNLFNHPEGLSPGGSLEAHLDELLESGGNYLRNVMSHRDSINIFPYIRDSNGRFDLNKTNSEYWDRFESLLFLTVQRDIIVQIEVWDGWDMFAPATPRDDGTNAKSGWKYHPFNPLNNVNYTADESGLLTEVTYQPAEEPTEHNFFHTVPKLENNTLVLRYQEAFVDKMLEISLQFPNVLYTINNESGEPAEWSQYWARRIHEKAKKFGVTAQVTDMRRKEDIMHATHRIVYDNNELYTFVDVSQNTGHQITDRRLQYHRLLKVRRYLDNEPRPINNVKIYNDNFGGAPKFMRNVFGGLASTRFHRPPRGLGLSEEAQQIISSVRTFTDSLNWFNFEPRPELLDHDDGVYLMADSGEQYAVGFDGGGSVELDARNLTGSAELRWMNLHEGKWIDGGRIEPGWISLQTPGEGLWVAVIR